MCACSTCSMEMVDKTDPLATQDGYHLAVAVDALMNLIATVVKLTAASSKANTPVLPSNSKPHPLTSLPTVYVAHTSVRSLF